MGKNNSGQNGSNGKYDLKNVKKLKKKIKALRESKLLSNIIEDIEEIALACDGLNETSDDLNEPTQ